MRIYAKAPEQNLSLLDKSKLSNVYYMQNYYANLSNVTICIDIEHQIMYNINGDWWICFVLVHAAVRDQQTPEIMSKSARMMDKK